MHLYFCFIVKCGKVQRISFIIYGVRVVSSMVFKSSMNSTTVYQYFMQEYSTSLNNKITKNDCVHIVIRLVSIFTLHQPHFRAKCKSLFLPRSQALLNHNIEHLVDIESIERLEFYYVS